MARNRTETNGALVETSLDESNGLMTGNFKRSIDERRKKRRRSSSGSRVGVGGGVEGGGGGFN